MCLSLISQDFRMELYLENGFFLIGVWLIYNVVLVPTVQKQNESVTHAHISSLF